MKQTCKICNSEFNNAFDLSMHLINKHNIKSKVYYDQFLKTDSCGKCVVCNNNTKFLNLSLGYRKYCSRKCTSNSENKKVALERFYNDNTAVLNAVKKRKSTNLQKYGFDNPTKNGDVRNKMKISNIKKYGVDHYSKTDRFQEKYKQTCLLKFNVDHPSKSKEILEKRANSNIKKYGVSSPLKLKNIKDKIKETNLQRYGVDNPTKNKDIFKKVKKTIFEKYGVENVSKLKKYKTTIKEAILKQAYYKIVERHSKYEPCFTVDEYVGCHEEYKWKCKNCNTVFNGRFSHNYFLYCPSCEPIRKNKEQFNLFEFLKRLDENIITNSRKILDNNKELDFYFPDKKLGVEYNSNYWHSEIAGTKHKNYHLEKTLAAELKDISLIHIFDDEWQFKEKTIKNKFRLIFGKIKYKIFARDCIIKEIDNKLKTKFLNKYHLQNSSNTNINLGLFYKNRLVSVMTFNKARSKVGFELSRYCSINNFIIIGGASKLLSYFERMYKPETLITFADRRWSKGDLYLKLGFIHKKTNPPSYWYTKDYILKYHKFNFRKHLLKKKLKNYDSTLSEWQNMQNNGYDRIWDCGNLVFVKKYHPKE